jgi:hypothetical protein
VRHKTETVQMQKYNALQNIPQAMPQPKRRPTDNLLASLKFAKSRKLAKFEVPEEQSVGGAFAHMKDNLIVSKTAFDKFRVPDEIDAPISASAKNSEQI